VCCEALLITTPEPTVIPDIDEDLTLGLTFYQLAHSTANEGRPQILADGGGHSRPVGYLPEMLKEDGNMRKIRQKPLDKVWESARARDAQRKQRDSMKTKKLVRDMIIL